MDAAEMRRRLAAARVAHLATVRPDGRPHVVPCCFAFEGDRLVTAVDAKPKRSTALQRLVNVAATGWATVIVDHYDDADWSALWWVRAEGPARVVDDPAAVAAAVELLAAKYPQYRQHPPPGPVIEVGLVRWRGWNAGGR